MKVLNILILDDEQMLLDLLTMMLRPHTSTVCSSLSEAQSLIASDPEMFDVMLCDIMMPRGGGLDLYEWLPYVSCSCRQVAVCYGRGWSRSTSKNRSSRSTDTEQTVFHLSVARVLERIFVSDVHWICDVSTVWEKSSGSFHVNGILS